MLTPAFCLRAGVRYDAGRLDPARWRTGRVAVRPCRARASALRLRRKEDARFLRGRGQFVGDIRRSGMLDVAFVRAPVAHARM